MQGQGMSGAPTGAPAPGMPPGQPMGVPMNGASAGQPMNGSPMGAPANMANIPNGMPPKNNNTAKIIIACICGAAAVGAIIFAIIFIPTLIGGGLSGKPFQGTWTCDNTVTAKFDGNKFEMYETNDRSKMEVAGTLEIPKNGKNGDITEMNSIHWTVRMKADKRVVDGNDLSSTPYTTEYEIAMDRSSNDEMLLFNTVTYTSRTCTRQK